MATIINTPPTTESSGSGAGWAVAVIILLAIIGVGAYFWLNYRAVPATGIDINVTLPENPLANPTPTP